MATLNPTNAIATQAVHHAAAQLAALDWIDQDAARQLSPMAEAVANMFMVLYYQAETGQATRTISARPWMRCGSHLPRRLHQEQQGRPAAALIVFVLASQFSTMRAGVLEHRQFER